MGDRNSSPDGRTARDIPAPNTREDRGEVKPADPLIGRTLLEQYRIERKLGEGGFGVTYLADQLGVDRKAVIKVVRARLSDDPVFVERFHREAKILAALDHHHLVKLYSFGQLEEGQLFFAMEYGGDRTLADEIDREKRLEVGRMLRIGEQVCEALAEAHRRGVIHRDLKPANILIGQKAGEDWVKVVDLGVAKILQASTPEQVTATSLTGEGWVMGTPAYYSPEQAQGLPLDGRSDLYALGIVLYEALVGVRPLHGSNTADFMRAHLQESPLPPRALGVDLPPAVEAAVFRSLEKSPARRFETADVMAQALRDARLDLTRPPRRRARPPLIVAGAIAGLAVVATSAWWVLKTRQPAPAVAMSPPPPAAAPASAASRSSASRPSPLARRGRLIVRAPGTDLKTLTPGVATPDLPITDVSGSLAVASADGRWKALIRYRRDGSDALRVTVETEPEAEASGPQGPLGRRPTLRLGVVPVPIEFRTAAGAEFSLVLRYTGE